MPSSEEIDGVDRAILDLLVADGRRTVLDIASTPRRSYTDLVEGEVADVHRHQVMLAVTVHAGRSARAVRGAGGGQRGACAVVLREGNKIGLKVTLRGDKMYEFTDRSDRPLALRPVDWDALMAPRTVVVVGATDTGTPREIILTPRSNAPASQPQTNAPTPSEDDDEPVVMNNPPEDPQPRPAAMPPIDPRQPRSPGEMLQELQRLRQQQQQQPGQPQQPPQ